MASCKSVLLVEDDNDLRESVRQVLDCEGYTVHEAEDGQVALDLLASFDPDELPGCILLDLMMPRMDGKTFLEVLMRDHRDDWAKITIIVNTAKGSTERDLDQLPPAVEILRKPIDIDKLIAAIGRHCGKPVI